jgi:hypothetical protein
MRYFILFALLASSAFAQNAPNVPVVTDVVLPSGSIQRTTITTSIQVIPPDVYSSMISNIQSQQTNVTAMQSTLTQAQSAAAKTATVNQVAPAP